MRQLIAAPAGFGDGDILPPGARLHFRGALASAWRLAETSFKNKTIPNNEEKGALIDAPIDLDRRTRMLSRFQDEYRFTIPIYDRQICRALSIANHLWAKRPFEFTHLCAAPAYTGRDSSLILAPKKIAGADLLYAPADPARKNDLRSKPPSRFLRTVKVLMYSYILAYVKDPGDQQWLNLSSAFA